MELTTPIQIPKPPFGISYADRMVLMGSCFAEHIGERLANDKFRVDNNPFGTLYNHASIAEGTPRLLEHQAMCWVTAKEAETMSFCPADQEIIERLKRI